MFTTYSRCNSQGKKKDIHINKLGVESFVDRSILMAFQYSCGSSSEGDRFSSLAGYRSGR